MGCSMGSIAAHFPRSWASRSESSEKRLQCRKGSVATFLRRREHPGTRELTDNVRC